MRITDLLHKEGIALDAKVNSKTEAIDLLVDLMDKTGVLSNKEEYKKGVFKREEEGTTGIGDGIAIPHAKTPAVKEAGLASMVVRNGVDYEALDGQPSKLFFLIAAPESADTLHLEVLSRLATILMDEAFRERLINAASIDDYFHLIDEKEQEKFPEEQKEEKQTSSSMENSLPQGYQVLAVTACPTGIAHTYMAAENLEMKAKNKGISIKVETDGSGGVKNLLTTEEIDNASCIIVAADKKVEMARFDGKRVIQTKVADGIHKADALLDQAISGNAPVYHHEGGKEEGISSQEGESKGRQIYMHLMNGVSHMLPFVIGGGILIALSFLFDNFALDPSNFGNNTPFAHFLNTVGNSAFSFMLPVLAGFIAMSIGDRPALAVGFVGGYLANTGGSGFLGALVAGFIGGYLILFLKKVFSTLPQSLEGIKPVLLYPFFGVLLMGAIIIYIINPPVGALNNWLSVSLNAMGESSKILLGIVLGGMMSVDMGGPVNKAAYVFGAASIANGQYDIMAAVMAGGMIPPLAIALSTIFFRNKFTAKERQSGLVNIIMGLSFITEGAIPFASSDPIRVIPSCVVGSAVAGGLSMFFGCTLMAPHGGIFVTPVVGNPIGYLISIAVGAIVGMLILGFIKKPVEAK